MHGGETAEDQKLDDELAADSEVLSSVKIIEKRPGSNKPHPKLMGQRASNCSGSS